MSNPLVTIIIAVKNGERFLEQAIGSVLAQDYEPYEILVVDGESTDRTVEIAQSFEGIRIVNQRGGGIASAYNTGIEEARGIILAFLSHDDLWIANKLTVQVGYLLAHPNVEYVTARTEFFVEPGHAIPPGFRRELLEGSHIAHIMETLVARRSVFDNVGTFDPKLSTAEDVDWFSRAGDLGISTAVMPQVLLRKRIHDTNLSMNVDVNNKNLLKVLRQSMRRKREK